MNIFKQLGIANNLKSYLIWVAVAQTINILFVFNGGGLVKQLQAPAAPQAQITQAK